ncbi:tyrosine-type recombinase/integrase [Vibrio sp. 1288]|uniref:tyrosine-type recombinase/integrase n=1 Tax=Vibrio sp. 1288 TaxID=3074550 RepID=UPI002966C265|nr:tyrosine-type recombinase/integrase [Vibrio sp. 1288]MDW3136311.1 tyrosine-type recombinase/integrase [Vibrio sp. 1288]
MAEKKSTKTVTNKAIEALTAEKGVLSDTGENKGLRIACGKTGRKTFTYRYRSPELNGKLVQIKLGIFPNISLEEARIKLRELKRLRDSGVCPKSHLERLEAEKQREQEALAVQKITVKDVVDYYLENYIEDKVSDSGRVIKGARKPKGQKEVRRTLYVDVVDVIGERAATSVTKGDIIRLVQGIVDRNASVQAGSVLRELSGAFDYAIGLDFLPDEFVNPALLARNMFKKSKVKLTSNKGKRVLSHDELFRFLKWLPESKFSKNEKGILRLTLWTGCRTGEVCNLTWSQIDFDKKTIHLIETKNGNARYVQVPNQAMAWLKKWQQAQGVSKSLYVFPSQRGNYPILQKQLTQSTWLMRRDGLMIEMPLWTPHDLRRTVRTELARMGCPTEVAEAVLGHSAKGIEGTYNLHRYESECRHWLQRWANELDAIANTETNIVQFPEVS